jgi:ABC-type uncharacterized transport system involved in gliding motility auxiliary subunit
MNPQWRRFAPFGIYLAVLAAISAFTFYLFQNSFSLGVQISLAFIIVGLAVFVILDPERVRVALTGRQAKYGSNALVLGIAVLGILVVINYLVYKNSPRWDLTEDKTNTLAPETLKLLKDLPKPVTAQGFFTSRTSSTTARNLLESFKANSNGKFDYKFIDPEANPAAAAANDVTRDGTIVFSMDNRKEQVSLADETEFSTAIIKLANPGKRNIYFLTGDGELDPNGSDPATSYSNIKTLLTNKNYTVDTINLVSKPSIPDDALAIVIVNPKQSLTDQEVNLLKDYVAKGHSILYFSDPVILKSDSGQPDAMGKYLSDQWGIQLDNDLVVDPTVNPPVVAATYQYGSHAITQKLQGLATVFPTARSLSISATPPQGVTLTALALTSDQAWGETDVNSLKANQVQFDQAKDHKGPLNLAAAGENPTTKARVVVIGDSDFASNQYSSSYGNADFAVNAIDWAAQQESLINITPKSPTQRMLVPPQRYVMVLLLLGLVIVMPGLVIMAGVYAWVIRRRRG